MFKEKVDNILKWYDSLESKKKLLVSIGILIALIILVNIFANINIKKGIIDYNWENGEGLIANLSSSNDREIYLKSNEIIKNLVLTEKKQYMIGEEKVKLSDWYEYVVFSEYKNEISKGKFQKIVKKISDNFGKENTLNNSNFDSIIENIYLYSDSYKMYVVKLNINDINYYLGLKYESDDTYSIFYIE